MRFMAEEGEGERLSCKAQSNLKRVCVSAKLANSTRTEYAYTVVAEANTGRESVCFLAVMILSDKAWLNFELSSGVTHPSQVF